MGQLDEKEKLLEGAVFAEDALAEPAAGDIEEAGEVPDLDVGGGPTVKWISSADRAPEGMRYFEQAYISIKPKSFHTFSPFAPAMADSRSWATSRPLAAPPSTEDSTDQSTWQKVENRPGCASS